MKELLDEIQKISTTVSALKSQLIEYENARYFDEWIPRKKLMEYFDYGDTQMAALLKNEQLKVSEIGCRKFIHKSSVIKLLEKNIKKEK
jgi:hypothetical protein